MEIKEQSLKRHFNLLKGGYKMLLITSTYFRHIESDVKKQTVELGCVIHFTLLAEYNLKLSIPFRITKIRQNYFSALNVEVQQTI